MALSTRLRLFYLLHFANPAADRSVYRMVHDRRIQSILEIGIGQGERALRMIEVAALHTPVSDIRYVGVDPFEDRSPRDGSGLSLKAAHRLLRGTGARTQLLPGDPLSALARTANDLAPVDMAVVSATADAAALSKAWFFMPRLLHTKSIVLVQDPKGGGSEFQELGLREVEALATKAPRWRRAA